MCNPDEESPNAGQTPSVPGADARGESKSSTDQKNGTPDNPPRDIKWTRWCYGLIFVAAAIGIIAGISVWATTGKGGVEESTSARGGGQESSAYVGEEECLMALQSSGYDLTDALNYDAFFDNDSVLTLAEAGQYRGPVDILEYVMFASSSSYLSIKNPDFGPARFTSYDEKTNRCSFRQLGHFTYTTNPLTTNKNINGFSTTLLTHVELDYAREIVSRVNVFLNKDYLSFFFGELLNTDQTRQYVCSVMNGPCAMEVEECEMTLANLPVATGDTYVDGNSQGCRALHAIFASWNQDHCAHLSFEPMEDPNGKIKCQESKGINPEDMFDSSDFSSFKTFQAEVGIDPNSGYAETPAEA